MFIVDANDTDRVGEARDELHRALSADELRDAVVLVYANKQDLPNSMGVAAVSEKLGLASMCNRQSWHVEASDALSGKGLYEGLNWMAEALAARQKKLRR